MIPISKENWLKYKRVQDKIEQGYTIAAVYQVNGKICIGTLEHCKFCGKEYIQFGREFSRAYGYYLGKGGFCSKSCGDASKGKFWQGKKRNPEYYHRGLEHPMFGKKIKDVRPNTYRNEKIVEEISLEEGMKYQKVQKAINDGKKIIRIIRSRIAIGTQIIVVTSCMCQNCGKETTSDNKWNGRVCSSQCSKELRHKRASKTFKKMYEDGSYTGSKGSTAWNKGMKVDKTLYPNWGTAFWNKLTEDEKITRLNGFTKPRRRNITVNGISYSVRSKFEENVIRLLDKFGVRFEYEPSMIILPDGHRYIPDFYLIDYKCFLEGKSISRMQLCEKMSIKDIFGYFRTRKSAIKEQKNLPLKVIWYERFHVNPERSLLKILNKVRRNLQRSELEESIANNSSVGETSPKRPATVI